MGKLLFSELQRRKGAIIGWTLALCFFGTIYMLLYPALPAEFREIDPQALMLLRSMGMQTFSTFDGWVLSTKFNVLPLIAGLCGLFMGIQALAAEEDDGTLELLASLPISRAALILSKAAAVMIGSLIAIAIAGCFAMLVFTSLNIDTPVTAFDMFKVILSHWLISFFFLSLSLFLGAYLPTGKAATVTSMGYLLTSFFGENLAGMAPVLDPYRPFFAFAYFKRITEMLTGEVAWGDIGVLLGTGIVFVALAVISFQRRNLTVRAWPWQRPKMES